MARYPMNALISIPVLVILIALVFNPFTMESDAQTTDGVLELNPITLHLTEGMALSPLDHDEDNEYQAVSIPNGFARTGFRGLGIIPVGDTVWKEVGTWYTQPLKQVLNLGGTVQVEAWAYKEETGDGTPTSQFRFEIMRGSDILLSMSLGGTTIREGEKVRLSVTGAFPPGNDTTIESGTPLSFKIYAKSNGGGATIRFGNGEYDSKFTFFSNSLEIRDIRISKSEAVLEYKDAFMVPWTNLYAALEIDRVKVPDDGISSQMNTINYTREIHWERKSGTGEYTVFASIGYSIDQNISDQKILEIKEKKENWFQLDNIRNLISGNMLMIIVILIGAAIVFTLVRRRKQTWNRRIKRVSPKHEDGTRKEKIRAWKDMNKERRKTRKDLRQERIVDLDEEPDEDELDEKEFNLFRKKILGRSAPVEVEQAEEMDLEL